MKMKKACEATNLTERAIRLYISKGLITPGQKEGLIDFSPEDIQHLRDIGSLRQMDFTMEQIGAMIANEEEIPDILAARRDAALSGSAHEEAVFAALSNLNATELTDLHALADGIRARSVSPTLNFTQFDEISDEARHLASAEASAAVDRQQKHQQWLRWLGWTAFLLAVVLAGGQFYLNRTCIEGYLPLSPITVMEVQGERATFRIGNVQAVEVLGRDTLTVPYLVDGFNTENRDKWGRPAVVAGETIDHATLLKIKLTNGDLLRLGINPLQDFDPPSVQRHNQWMTLILRAVMADGESDDCILLLREHSGTKPLLWLESHEN